MKHRDRVIAALNHELPDRCPMQVSCTPEFATRLTEALAFHSTGTHNPHGGGNTYEIERAIGSDMLLSSVGWVNGYYQPGYEAVDHYTDEWGVTWRCIEYTTRFGKGKYTEPFGHPLVDDASLYSYKAPDPLRPELYSEVARTLHDFKDEYWIVGVTPTTIFESAWALRGYDKLLMDLAVDPDRADHVLNITFNYHMAVTQQLARLGVDMIWLGDDMGIQNTMLLSPPMWRKFFKPKMATLIASLKAINPALKVAYHSDGAIYPIIPDLIEIGLDVLNPIQPASMDPVRLKRDYGDKLCFWGSMDIQHTLPNGTPEEVRQEVLLRLRTIGKQGGLIIGPTHNLQLDTPLENFWAMVNTVTDTPYSALADL
jgi:uroporphyrinogen decarboxylase